MAVKMRGAAPGPRRSSGKKAGKDRHGKRRAGRKDWKERVSRMMEETAQDGKGKGAKGGKGGKGSREDAPIRKGDKRPREEDKEEAGFEEGIEAKAEEDSDPRAIAKRKRELFEKETKDNQLFVSNLPFDTTEDEVKERFSVFGAIKKVLLVKDKVTERLNGSGFVHFKNPASVQKVLAEEARLKQEAEERQLQQSRMSRKQLKSLRFKGKLLEQQETGIEFSGRKLRVKPVVQRDQAKELTRQAQKEKIEKEQADPRNLHLLEEGRIVRGTPAAIGVPDSRLQLLSVRYQNKKKKLKDPNYFVSRTRLCFRDIPTHVDEKGLRKLVMKSIKEYTDRTPDFTWETCGKRNPFIKQLKLMKTEKNTSRGFGFVEFRHHVVALEVLRNLNNNPTIFGPHHRLDVEFAVESVHALQRLTRITEKGKEKHRVMKEMADRGEDPVEGWRKLREKKKEEEWWGDDGQDGAAEKGNTEAAPQEHEEGDEDFDGFGDDDDDEWGDDDEDDGEAGKQKKGSSGKGKPQNAAKGKRKDWAADLRKKKGKDGKKRKGKKPGKSAVVKRRR